MVFIRGVCVYIITNKLNTVLNTGVTSNLVGRVWEHKNEVHPKSFTGNTTAISWFILIFTLIMKRT